MACFIFFAPRYNRNMAICLNCFKLTIIKMYPNITSYVSYNITLIILHQTIIKRCDNINHTITFCHLCGEIKATCYIIRLHR